MITKSELLNDLIKQGCLRLGTITMSQDVDENGDPIFTETEEILIAADFT